ncbi:hypothetical protein D3C76_804180 [compost metagenome]
MSGRYFGWARWGLATDVTGSKSEVIIAASSVRDEPGIKKIFEIVYTLLQLCLRFIDSVHRYARRCDPASIAAGCSVPSMSLCACLAWWTLTVACKRSRGGAGRFNTETSFRRHHHCKRHLDELFIPIDGFQSAAHVVGDVSRSSLLDPVRQFHDGGFQGELVFVDLESSWVS